MYIRLEVVSISCVGCIQFQHVSVFVFAKVFPASIRVSVGYEDIDDIKADFEQAFAAAKA